MMIHSVAEKILGNLDFYDMSLRQRFSLEDLISLNEKYDRLVEALDLVTRADEKATAKAKSRLFDKSPLSSFKFMLKTNKRRPS